MKIFVKKKTLILLGMACVVVLIIVLAVVFSLIGDNEAQVFGAVVSNGRGCAEIGRDMLSIGGSSADATIATLICEGVMCSQCMGIGGGFVATIYTKSSGKVETLIAREMAPLAAYKDMFVGLEEVTGILSVAVPGEVMGYWELHQRYGRLPWKVLFQDTIKLCREGHWVSPYLAKTIKENEFHIRNESTLAEIFIKSDGSLYKEGDFLKRLTLANTLERIANNGVNEYYNGGQTGKLLIQDIQAMNGIITEEDLKNYKVQWETEDLVVANINEGYKLYTTPLPSSGPVLAFILNILNSFPTDDYTTYWHRMIEAFKHAYGQRSSLGDFLNDPEMADTIKTTYNRLLDPEFAHKIRTLISDDKTSNDISYYGANFTVRSDKGTANVAVLSPDGDAITVTSTINNYFGAKLRSHSTGIILNNEMDDFSTPGMVNAFGVPASPSNYIRSRKRPMSSMCPSIVLDREGNVRLLIGSAGGTKITTVVAQTIAKYLIFNETLEEAVNNWRVHHQLMPMYVEAEPHIPSSIVNYLKGVGHDVKFSVKGVGFAALTAIGVRDGIPEPIFDQRRIGSTALMEPVLLIHGGAGNITDARVKGKLDGMKHALRTAIKYLKPDSDTTNSSNAVLAVESAVMAMECDENFNAGYGSCLNTNGECEVEASIMEGSQLKAGCVTLLHDIMHPISVAHCIMLRTNHTFLGGEPAQKFALDEGFQQLPAGSLVTEDARYALAQFKERQAKGLDTTFARTELDVEQGIQERPGEPGTVGAVAIDCHGNIAVATSTGGITGKIPGRIGDTPLLGCGTYADNTVGGVSTTGHGETIMRFNLAQKILTKIKYENKSAQLATEEACNEMTERLIGTGGAITIDAKGRIGIYWTSRRMAWAYIKGDTLVYGINAGEQYSEPI